jgi:thiosulfate/3-mercaptopyruvate sulfurtransferase
MKFTTIVALLASLLTASPDAQRRFRPMPTPVADGPVVSTAWVAERMQEPNLVLLHVGPEQAYASAHVPGARLVTSAMISVRHTTDDGETLNLEMPEPDALRASLAALGISDDSRIVVYAATLPVMTTATRVVLTLQYAGLGERTFLLQGGLNAWTTEGRQTTDVVPEVTPGTLSALTIAPVIVDADAVDAQRSTSGVSVVDARARALYTGEQTGGGRSTPHKTGHIAGAVNVPFNSTYDHMGRFKSPDDLRTMFLEAGVRPGDTVIAYCHIGQQATATILAARLAGFDVKLYDGSLEDWSRRPNAAVTNLTVK